MAMPGYLRPDLPTTYGFSVTARPWVAKLDQNEAPVDLPDELKRELTDELCTRAWNRYVQPGDYVAAREVLAGVAGVAPERLAIVAGADQGLWAAAAIAGGPGRTIRWFEPTYPFVGHVARMSRGTCQPVELGANIDAELSAAHLGDANLVYLVSPNNPTGGMVSRELVRHALETPDRLVVVDEAYFDFSRESVADLLDEFDNLLIVRSLSKSLVAAVHLGYVLGSPSTIGAIETLLTAPYHLNAQQILIAARYGQIRPHVLGTGELVRRERARVSEALGTMDGVLEVYASAANFVLFRVRGDATAVARALAEAGVRVRDVSRLAGLAGHLRVTIGTREDNDAFLAALASALGA